jgi:L-ascorbate metabolism protein UlaG (beta-lactamase superfamily)
MASLVRLSSFAMALAAAAAIMAVRSSAQAPQPPAAKPEMRENCPGLVASDVPRAIPAAFRLALKEDEVRINYVGHSTFLIESPQGVRITTDYNDYVRPSVLPDIATMNHAHDTHYTDRPDPRIKYVLRGWGPSPSEPARHDLQLKDVRVRNVPTNIRTWNGGTERHGNSIFIFEMANLCIAHLGHLHHTLTQQQLDEIGRIDVLFVPVDGSFTLDLDGMVEVLQAIKSPLMVPMHYFNIYTLHRFLDRLRPLNWSIETNPVTSTVVSKAKIPSAPKVLVLPGR